MEEENRMKVITRPVLDWFQDGFRDWSWNWGFVLMVVNKGCMVIKWLKANKNQIEAHERKNKKGVGKFELLHKNWIIKWIKKGRNQIKNLILKDRKIWTFAKKSKEIKMVWNGVHSTKLCFWNVGWVGDGWT